MKDVSGDKRISAPNGWVIKSYRHMNVQSSDFDDVKKLFDRIHLKQNSGQDSSNSEQNPHRDITYGNYDRIQLIPINSFSDFTNESSRAFNWYGSSQAILVFPLENEKGKRHFRWGENDLGKEQVFVFNGNDDVVTSKTNFFCASFCYISDKARNTIQSYEKLMGYCNKSILDLVDKYNSVIEGSSERDNRGTVMVEVFGSLSSAEVIILWSAKQYTDVLYLMDCIRDFSLRYDESGSNINLFRTTYTMISFPDIVRGEGTEKTGYEIIDPSLSEILGQAHIQFVMQDGVGEEHIEAFKDFLEICFKNSARLIGEEENPKIDISLNRCAGEYDLIGYVESKYVPRLFINPENLFAKDEEIKEKGEKAYFCSVHNRQYNQYVLYSFTRLSYKETDLPKLGDAKWADWGRERRKISDIILDKSYVLVDSNIKRSDLLKGIEDRQKTQFKELIKCVAQHIPTTSNLIMELNQLFSDYVQCCSSCADYLWIEDYNELVLQVFERIKKSVLAIEVWKKSTIENSQTDEYAQEWEDARERLKNITDLIKSLHKQTGHILASNKLFFKEQDIHLGYTAQHDLVLHAYYGIIKKLIGSIYEYTNNHIQSRLYPLVNFSVDNQIGSKIYSEESAGNIQIEFESNNSGRMPSRIMVIHIPLDGMDNLMHYLPMLIHEVYHYAAPRDRGFRNRILAKIFIYQVLRRGFENLFREKASEYIIAEDDKCIKAVDAKLERLSKEFTDLTDKEFYQVIEENSEAIYKGIKANFNESDKIDDSVILRSWFVDCLYNWLNDTKHRNENKWSDDLHQNVYYNFSDLYHEIFNKLIKALNREIDQKQREIESGEDNREERVEYLSILKALNTQLALESTIMYQKATEQSDSLTLSQGLSVFTWKYLNHKTELQKLSEVLDEIFPDLAMVIHTQMPISGYMLQTALNLDKQLYSGNESVFQHLRFGTILNYLISKTWAKQKKSRRDLDINTMIEDEFTTFKKMYMSSYQIASQGFDIDEDVISGRANKWCSVFRLFHGAIDTHGGITTSNHMVNWAIELIAEMNDCLVLSDEYLKIERERYFVEPYHRYLIILQEDDLQKKQNDLFKLSISMIQQFQNSITLRKMNGDFGDTKYGSYSSGKAGKVVESGITIYKNYERDIRSSEYYLDEINYALEQLYRYRDKEHISTVPGMWYRGVSTARYPVLPSGFVHYAEDADQLQKGFPNIKNPYSYAKVQLHNYESFRYSSEGGSAEVNPSTYYRTINYITLMQHYSQHTNFVDWSEDCFASSYFALEDEVNVNDKYEYQRYKKTNFQHANEPAVLYVLDPVRFNIACEEIEAHLNKKPMIRYSAKNNNSLIIPNLSIEENLNDYREYHDVYSAKTSGECFISIDHTRLTGKTFLLNKEGLPKDPILLSDMEDYIKQGNSFSLKLPRAIYAAKLNARIRAQSGLFVAFSLQSKPVIWKGEKINTSGTSDRLFGYQALGNIQDYYLSLPNKDPFMMKILIPAKMKIELGRNLYKCGISKEKIYPQLDNYRHR